MYYMFDDHEIVDNYRLMVRKTGTCVNAVRSWREYAGRGNPDSMLEVRL